MVVLSHQIRIKYFLDRQLDRITPGPPVGADAYSELRRQIHELINSVDSTAQANVMIGKIRQLLTQATETYNGGLLGTDLVDQTIAALATMFEKIFDCP